MMKGDAPVQPPLAHGFSPAAQPDARVLILGSLPGRRSLEMREYYAKPQNAFWRIMGALVGAGPELPYPARLQKLTTAGIALWDVVAAGAREGSLDAAIVTASVVVNDFPGFFAAHPGIRTICFNGRKAAELYQRRVAPLLPGRSFAEHYLPSTSPAHAARAYDEKLALWRGVLEPLLPLTSKR